MKNKFLFHPISNYTLMEFGISLRNVNLLIEEGLVLFDFFEQTDIARKFSAKKRALSKKISELKPLITEQLFQSSLYKLVFGGLSLKNVELLRELQLSYEDVPKLTYVVFKERLGGANREVMFQRIQVAYEKTQELIGQSEDSNEKMYEAILLSTLQSLPPRQAIGIFELKRRLIQELHVKPEQIKKEIVEELLQKWLNKGLISKSDLGYTKKYTTFLEYLEFDFQNKEEFIKRLNNATLREIGDEYGVSHERIRQRIKKVIQKMPQIEELLVYQKTFEKYDWPEQLFCNVYEEHVYVYRFLNLKLKRGTKKLTENYDELQLNSSQKELVLKYYEQYVNYEGELKSYSNKIAFFEHLIYNLGQKVVQHSEFIDVANEFIRENNLSESLLFDERNVLGLADRSLKVLRTHKLGFRFYDLRTLESYEILKLKELLNLEPGIYSMYKLFNENGELMHELNIDSEYELHNLYKKIIELPNVEFTRMPEFAVGGVDKNEFLVGLFHELAPISIDDFAKYVEDNFGLKPESLKALLANDFIQYIHESNIVVEHEPISDEELERFKTFLTKEIYTIDELVILGKKLDDNFHNKYINNYFLLQVGYYIKGTFVLSTKYQSVDQFFIKHIKEPGIFQKTKSGIYQTSSFLSALYSLESDLEVIRIEPNLYISDERLAQANILKEHLIAYREAVYEFAKGKKYFTLPELRMQGFVNKLEEYGFADIFYERIIWTHPKLRVVHTASHMIFKETDEDINLAQFLQFVVAQYEKIDVYKFQKKLEETFEIIMTIPKIVELIRGTDMYYSPEMEQVYISRDVFYQDIYH